MKDTVLKEVTALTEMPYKALKDRWRSLYGTEPPAYSRQMFIRRLAYRIQELAFGGLSEEAWTELERIAAEDDLGGKARKAGPRKRCKDAAKSGYDTCPVKSVAASEIENAVVEQLRRVFRSPDMIARTFRTAQEQVKQQAHELTQQKARLQKRLRELRRAIGRLVRAGGDGEGALAEELRALNEEYAEVEGRIREIDEQMEALHQAGPTEGEVRDTLQKLDPVWDELFPAERERIVKLLVKEAVIKTDGLEIHLRTNGLRSLVADVQGRKATAVNDDGGLLDIHIPMEFHRRSGWKEIISPETPCYLPPDPHTTRDDGPRRPIVLALAQAYKWQKMLDSGKVGALDKLAERHDVDRSYVSRIPKLATIAPEVTETILAGNEPSGLSLAKLRGKLPLLWNRQRQLLIWPVGFET